MAGAVYIMGTLVTALCAFLLLRAFARVGQRLLLWSGLCFLGLTVANALVFVDLQLIPSINLYTWRLLVAAVAMLLLVYGLIRERS